MNLFQIKEHLLTIYLGAVMLILSPPTLLNISFILIPLLIISSGIYLKKTVPCLMGLSLFYLISIQTLSISSMENIAQVLLYLLIISTPSLVLLSHILQLHHPSRIIFTSGSKKPLFLSITCVIVIMVVFYLITLLMPNSSLLAPDTLEVQVLILAALSIFVTMPLLIKYELLS
ncbi:MAG: hypothetical protein KKC68_01135 [Candidatus Thermoplasmatota archaeon]|nr:hypothetical protein [Candidatus Thermoplasmatota archaeon]MBU1940354.1 hypothetical protein [Candidatus Thermoplasmatota archaeon]